MQIFNDRDDAVAAVLAAWDCAPFPVRCLPEDPEAALKLTIALRAFGLIDWVKREPPVSALEPPEAA